MDIDEYLALYHQDLQSRGHQATIKVEYDQTQRQENPHYHKLKSDMSHDFKSVANSNGHGEDFALFMDGRNYGWTDHCGNTTESDFGKYRKVVVHGSCHSRCMMLESETDWPNVKECVNFENTDIGKELSIVSEQTKSRLSQAMNNIKLDEKPTVAVVSTAGGFSLVN